MLENRTADEADFLFGVTMAWNIPGLDVNNVLRAPSGRNAPTDRTCQTV